MKDIRLALEAEVNGCRAEFFLNDIPLSLLEDDDKDVRPVNHYMINGENTVSIVVDPGTFPGMKQENKIKKKLIAPIHVRAQLVKYPEGVFPGDPSGVPLISINLNFNSGDEVEFPYVATVKDKVDLAFDRWVWQDADDLDLSKNTVQEVQAVLMRLQQSLKSGVPDEYIDLYKYRYEEFSKAFGLDVNNLIKSTKDTFEERKTNNPDLEIEDLTPTKFSLRLIANKKMIECIAKDWQPILRSKPNALNQVENYFDVRVSRIGGKMWVIR